jgi:hypothetical protein
LGVSIVELLGPFHEQLFSLLTSCPRKTRQVLSAEILTFRELLSIHMGGDHDSTVQTPMKAVFLAYNGTCRNALAKHDRQ